MANEIKVTLGVNYTNGQLKDSIPQETVQITQTNQELHATVVSVGTSEEDLTLGDLTANGMIGLRNLDATNFVKWGPKSGGAMIELGRLKPNEGWSWIRLAPAVVIRWIADTGACKVQVKSLGN